MDGWNTMTFSFLGAHFCLFFRWLLLASFSRRVYITITTQLMLGKQFFSMIIFPTQFLGVVAVLPFLGSRSPFFFSTVWKLPLFQGGPRRTLSGKSWPPEDLLEVPRRCRDDYDMDGWGWMGMGMLKNRGGFPVVPLKENNGRKVLVFEFFLVFFEKIGDFLRRRF